MMGTATLQPPKSGRSRFSKALPAPPSLPAFDFESIESVKPEPQAPLPPVPRKEPPAVQSEPRLPTLPPPKPLFEWEQDRGIAMATIAKPLDSPLPPLPFKPAGPPPMSIPRRPVAAPVVSPPPPAPASAPVPASAPIPVPALAPPERTPSPGGSFSSLLSAYSNHTTESTPRSSTNSTTNDIPSSKNPYTVVSPTLATESSHTRYRAYTPPASSDQNAQRHEANGSQTHEADRDELPPPPPLKDPQRGFQRPQTPASLQTQTAQPPTSTQSTSPLGNTSPQEQLWRRRSLKTDKNFAVPELKLVSSHGSTAASVQNPSQGGPEGSFPQPILPAQGQGETSTPATTTQPQPPRRANVGLPGRNIRPVVPSEESTFQGDVSMGQGVSRIKDKLGYRRQKSEKDANVNGPEAQVFHAATTLSPPASQPTVSPLSPPRVPTPEYGTNEAKSPPLGTIGSPVSPASSPEPPGELNPAVAGKAGGPPQGQVRHAKSTPSLAAGAGNPGLGVQAPMGLPTSSAPDRERGREQTQRPARTPSSGSDDMRPVSAATRSDAQSSSWDLKPISETGSIETLKPMFRRPPDAYMAFEELPLREPDPYQPDTTDNAGAARFPRNWYTPLPADAILDPRPLADKHYRCLTNHRYMTANRQRTNPIGCRTCGHKDRNAECYICSACHLNVCSGCSGLLRRFRGDLRQVLRQVKEKKAAEMAERQHLELEESATAAILEA
ncbi:FYVE-type domain-containing protein [Madurella fahalii]|uniref:FYVE-type domain-containing protein n=1 Tax=Madurella fahalii TaxID=1157608 RepID=A0ABQ0GS89_9PEZI